ncbi:hypothetical protein NUW58_g6413 [Xylaria curta]|uniref:Uncharacterized protein n=1 Tax=Xylaria curta TaxID=42375 RepID=A0ACC1NW78_9PEZI|nr:hypothetical protein NUW58_g6413 [Xylaria curta]
MASERSLGTLYSHSLAFFQKFLVRCSRYGELESSRGLERCYEEYSRLKIWGHQKRATLGPSVPGSLESALQDRPELQNILLEIYEQIIDCFQRLDLLTSGSLIGSLVLLTEDHGSDDESEPTDSGLEPASGALDPVFEGIEELYRLSSLISRPRLTGRYLRSTRPILNPACQQEHQHIRQKFLTWRTHQKDDIMQDHEQEQEIGTASQTVLPKEETATPDLIANRQSAEEMHNPFDYILSQRLAIANMKRREQFKYWDTHPYQINSENLEPISSGLPPPPSSVFTTTSVPRSTIILDQSNPNINAIPRTNYAPTEVGKHTAMRVPDMPQSADAMFFEIYVPIYAHSLTAKISNDFSPRGMIGNIMKPNYTADNGFANPVLASTPPN